MMKRTDREQNSGFALGVVRDCEYATLATINPEGNPYCIPLSPVLIDDAVYFHCALTGEKLDNIKNNSSVCLSCVKYTKLIPEKFTTEFESAVVMGKCHIIEDETEKIEALRVICEKYAHSNMAAFDKTIKASLTRTAVCKIIIQQITGKANRHPSQD